MVVVVVLLVCRNGVGTACNLCTSPECHHVRVCVPVPHVYIDVDTSHINFKCTRKKLMARS